MNLLLGMLRDTPALHLTGTRMLFCVGASAVTSDRGQKF